MESEWYKHLGKHTEFFKRWLSEISVAEGEALIKQIIEQDDHYVLSDNDMKSEWYKHLGIQYKQAYLKVMLTKKTFVEGYKLRKQIIEQDPYTYAPIFKMKIERLENSLPPFKDYLDWVARDKFLVEMANMRNIDVLLAFSTVRLGRILSSEVKKFIMSWGMTKLTKNEQEVLIEQYGNIPYSYQSNRKEINLPEDIIDLTEEEKKIMKLTETEKTAILASTELYNVVQKYSPSTVEKDATPYKYSLQKLLLADDVQLNADEPDDLKFLINISSLLTGDWLDIDRYLNMVRQLSPEDRGNLRLQLNDTGLIEYRISKRV